MVSLQSVKSCSCSVASSRAGVETLSGVGVVSGAVWVVCSGVGVLLSMDWETSGVLVSWLLSAAFSLEPPQAVMDKISARDIPYMIAFFITVSSRAVTVTAFLLTLNSFHPRGTEPACLPLSFCRRDKKSAHRYKDTHARTKVLCYVLYTTRITHLANSTRLHYTVDVVLLTQLCMVP